MGVRMTSKPRAVERFAELDGIRGVAVLVVMCGHYLASIEPFFPALPKSPFTTDDGRFGVQLFFLVSGYVILMTAERSKKPSDFVIARFSRLYPVYWAILSCTLFVIWRSGPSPFSATAPQAAVNYTMWQRFLRVPDVDPVYWTLAVELTFYAFMLVLLITHRRQLTDALMRVVSSAWCAIATVTCILIREQAGSTFGKVVLNLTVAEYAALFSAGMMFFIGRQSGRHEPLSYVFCGVAVLNAWVLRGPHEGIAIAFVCAFFAAVLSAPRVPVLAHGPLNFLGRISYSAYLIHSVPGFLAIASLTPYVGRLAATFLTAVGVIVLAYVSFRYLEGTVGRWTRRALLAARDRSSSTTPHETD